jgi:drug/metabolite transporter (DMT)-like permease
MAVITATNVAIAPFTADVIAWLCFLYTALFSMFLGFFAWYRGLAIGPMTTVSQIQLTQPVFTLLWSSLILGEILTPDILIGGAVILLCSFVAVKSRVSNKQAPSVSK